LNSINRVTEGFNSFTGSISKVGMVIGLFNIIKGAWKKFEGWLTKNMLNAGKVMGKGFA
jgi:hypothetical protein